MDSHGILLMQLTLLGLILAAKATPAAAQAKPGCQNSCGNISIPYPFGTNDGPNGCYIDEFFLITCNTTFNPPKAFYGKVQVLNISLEGQLRIWVPVALDCYNVPGYRVFNNPSLTLAKFPISNTRNKFTAVGCDTQAVINGSRGQIYTTGCLSLCDNIENVINGSCSGIGCCQTAVPRGVRGYDISVSSYSNHKSVLDFNNCSYAFVVEDGMYNFSSIDLLDLQNRTEFPVVLDWAIEDQTCDDAKKNQSNYACGENSYCFDSDNGPGYRCNCSDGFQGNPYLPNGCQDIDECKTLSPCDGTCHNFPGSFNCSCPVGYEGDGTKKGTGCSLVAIPNHQFPLVNIALGIGITVVVLLVGSSWLYFGLKRRRLIKLKEKFFLQNGGLMLQQQLSRRDISNGSAKIFTAEELGKATNNYDEGRIIGRGGYGTVYKGFLADNSMVAIKKSKIVDQSQIEQFINEVVVLSQINHRNVVRLLGCCLETEVPLLVYEFVSNGTLFDHIHNESKATNISWEIRLRIAAETAGVLSYLHSAASTPIIHRDVKPTNILLDDNYTAKVSDFGASRLVPLDETQLSTLVQGTLGYLDPEYLHTSQLTEKSDVYSFGVVLVELLTGKMALSFDRPENERSLAMYFLSSLKENRLFQVVENCIMNEENTEQLKEVANLAKMCLKVKGEERPTMKDVAMELEGVRKMEMHPWVNVELNLQETEYLLGESSINFGHGGSDNTTAGYDSIRNHVILPVSDGR